MLKKDIPTPSIVIDANIVRRNIARMASYAASNNLKLRPHTKTHKSLKLAKMQLESGAVGLSVAKVGEAITMAEATDELLIAFPILEPRRCAELAKLAAAKNILVAIDSSCCAKALSQAADSASTVIGILVELDVGMKRTGVQTPEDTLRLAQEVEQLPQLRLDGIMFYLGHIWDKPERQEPALKAVDSKLEQTIELWQRSGLEAKIVSGGSTPTAYQSGHITNMTEIRPGTFIFNDMNCVRGGFASMEDCAARIVCTVVSDSVPGQVVINAGSKTLSSDICILAPDSGHGYIVEYPKAKIVKLNEEHGMVDVTACENPPKLGEQINIIPNHICACVNLQDYIWWQEEDKPPEPIPVDARGKQ